MLAAHMATGTHGQDTPSPLPAACRPPPLFSPPPPASPTASPSLPPPTLPLAFWPLPAPPPLHSPLPSLRHHRYPHRSLPHRHRPSPQPPSPPPPLTAASLTATAPHRSLPHRHRPSPQPPSPPPPLTAASLTATAPSLPPKAVLTEATGGSLKYNLTVRAAAACPVGRCTASAGTRHTFATLLAEQEEIRLLYFEQRAKTYIEEVLVPALGISVFYYVMEFAWARRFRDRERRGGGRFTSICSAGSRAASHTISSRSATRGTQ